MARSSDWFLHPLLWGLLLLLGIVTLARQLEPERSRERAMRAFADRHLLARQEPVAGSEREPGEPGLLEGGGGEELAANVPFENWYLDDATDPDVCAFDFAPRDVDRLVVHGRGRTLSNGTEILLSGQDLAFLGWVAFTYRINPHFLLGVMVAESNGNCSAVSHAGAQGCFQITYRQGAGQLKNSFPDRVASWYWAARTNLAGRIGGGDADRGYWPADLYVPPEVYFDDPAARGSAQLRMTIDPVATLTTSDRFGDVEVSSVASFSFGVVGAALYFHYLNHYLYSHVGQIGDIIRDFLSEPGAKAWWMAAAYNQGGPRTLITLGRRGADDFWRYTAAPVVEYASTVADYCEQFQTAPKTYGGTMTWGRFSDFLEQLRWTYSEVPIDWNAVRARVREQHFVSGTIDLARDLPAVFRTMLAADPHLAAEEPVLDHHVTF